MNYLSRSPRYLNQFVTTSHSHTALTSATVGGYTTFVRSASNSCGASRPHEVSQAASREPVRDASLRGKLLRSRKLHTRARVLFSARSHHGVARHPRRVRARTTAAELSRSEPTRFAFHRWECAAWSPPTRLIIRRRSGGCSWE